MLLAPETQAKVAFAKSGPDLLNDFATYFDEPLCKILDERIKEDKLH